MRFRPKRFKRKFKSRRRFSARRRQTTRPMRIGYRM